MLDVLAYLESCAPQVHPVTMAAVIKAESNNNPYAIGVHKNRFPIKQPHSRSEAIATATLLQSLGYSFDGGLGQINSKNLSVLGMTIDDLFNPCRNLQGASALITDCYKRATPRLGQGQPALYAALSCYNTGNFSAGITNGYVQRITASAATLVPALRPKVPLSSSVHSEPSTRSSLEKKASVQEDAFHHAQSDVFSHIPYTAKGP